MVETLAGAWKKAKAALVAAGLVVAAAPAGASDMDLRVDLESWQAADEELVALLFDGAPPAEDTDLERVVRVPDLDPRQEDNARLTLRLTDLEPGRYGIAIYPNDALGRLDVTGVGVPPTDRSLKDRHRRRPRFQYAVVRVTDATLSLGVKLTY